MDFDLITREEFDALLKEVEQLKKKVAQMEDLQDEWVRSKVALRITGMSAKTLKKKREMPNSLILYKFEGPKTVLYSRKSLFEYNESRKLGRRR